MRLIVFPQKYPTVSGESTFFYYQFSSLLEKSINVEVVRFGQIQQPIDHSLENIIVRNPHLPNQNSLKVLLRYFGLITFIILKEIRFIPFSKFLKYLRQNLSSIILAVRKVELLEKKGFFNHDAIFFSFWMNESALLVALAKQKKLISKFIFRVHGFDLYNEYRPDGYIPFTSFIYSKADRVFTVSEYGKRYLHQKVGNRNKKKLVNSYIGIPDYGMAKLPEKNQILTIVSCSSINIRKRVNLIVEALSHIKTCKVSWIHFGQKGDWGDKKDLEQFASESLGKNISFSIKGYTPNQDLINFYINQPVHAFIHLSETEGGPSIACVEAISFGIPLVATAVGGVNDLFEGEVGIKLSAYPSTKSISEAILKIAEEPFQTMTYRKEIKKFWRKNFSMEKTGKKFIEELEEISN